MTEDTVARLWEQPCDTEALRRYALRRALWAREWITGPRAGRLNMTGMYLLTLAERAWEREAYG